MVLSNQNVRSKARPFQLVKHFAWASFIVLAIFSFPFSMVISENAKQILFASYEDKAILVGEYLSHQVFRKFVEPTILRHGNIRLNDRSQMELMDQVTRNAIHGFNVDLVNAYNIDNTQIVYSTYPGLVGRFEKENLDYKKALEGHSSGTIFTEQGAWGLGMGTKKTLRTYVPFRKPVGPSLVKRDLSSSASGLKQGQDYAPFREPEGANAGESGALGSILELSGDQTYVPPAESVKPETSEGWVLGIFELHQDMSEQNGSIVRFQWFVFGLSLLIMGLIFLSLLLIVQKAQGMIERRAQEQNELVAQLHQAERLAALGEMVASVSHEIKNPLGIIRSTSELLGEMPEADEPHKRLSKVITGESTRLNQIVTEFLDFARPEVPNPHRCHLEDIIGRLISFMRPELDKRGITVNDNLVDRSLKLFADQELLYRAFLNILINAMESMEDGGGIVIRVEKEGNFYCIEFEDTGCGISEENTNRVLEPFFTTKNKGTGLGLSIVKKIIEAHGGTVEIQSREGAGTKITLWLPHEKTPSGGR